MIFSVPKGLPGRLAYGLEQAGTGYYPTGFSMELENKLSESYAEMARMTGIMKADGEKIKGYGKKVMERELQYR